MHLWTESQVCFPENRPLSYFLRTQVEDTKTAFLPKLLPLGLEQQGRGKEGGDRGLEPGLPLTLMTGIGTARTWYWLTLDRIGECSWLKPALFIGLVFELLCKSSLFSLGMGHFLFALPKLHMKYQPWFANFSSI